MNETSIRSMGVVGGGIVGLAVARELTRRMPGLKVTVFEAESKVAVHQSGHNSGVVHAGVYYPEGSLKASLCTRGGNLLREFCAGAGIPVLDIGKLIVASSESELAGLASIEARATANQVPGLRRISAREITEIEPAVRGVAALESPKTAVIDYPRVCEALATQIAAAGGEVRLSAAVRSISDGAVSVTVRTERDTVTVDRLVVCAGLNGDFLADQVDGRGDLQILPFRGEYFELRPSIRTDVHRMIYPVPDPRYPFLGVHVTPDIHGRLHVGPNALLALALHGYRRSDVDFRDLKSMVRWPGTWRMAREHWRFGATELMSSLSVSLYARQLRTYLPQVSRRDLVRGGSGVRAQAVTRSGELVDDFVINRSGNVTLVRNAPSPAATSSLAIAEHVVDRLSERA